MRLLRSKERSERWNANHRGALASAVANRQWTQERCAKAGYALHYKCLFCMHRAGGDTEANRVDPAIPTGNGRHRAWGCPTLQPARVARMAPPAPAGPAYGEAHRALLPSRLSLVPPPSAHHTIHWVVQPAGGSVRGRFYTNGSGLDGRFRPLGRLGWAFQARSNDGGLTWTPFERVPALPGPRFVGCEGSILAAAGGMKLYYTGPNSQQPEDDER